jgi:uncharacterized membrane protein YkvA (DUF1232 family)
MMNFLKNLKNFLVHTANDERIPSRDKKVLLALIALLISPIDFIPDWIPFFGILDDVVILSLILDYFFSVLDDTILLSHFPWTMKTFVRLRTFARVMKLFVPKFLKKKLWTYVGSPY